MPQSFRAGDIEIHAVSDGILTTSTDLIVGLDRRQAEQMVGPTDSGALTIPVNNFLFHRNGKTLLIDAGAGNTMQPTLGKLPSMLKAAGTPPESVTSIIITHLHGDHANGLVDDDGNAVYPNAEIMIHETEFEFWMRESSANDPQRVRRTRVRNRINMKPYLDRIRTLREGETLDDCTPVLAPGHCPGHTCWRIGTGREAFLAWGDLVHLSAVQIARPDINLTYDLDPDMARQSRRRILDMVAADGLTIAGAHVDAPGVGRVVRKGSAFAYEHDPSA